VELFFDNSDGQIGGEFAAFNEISVKRQVGRDGISAYTLNGTRCRRKDIKDLFLGTGLGSTSYSIIEQGMISQVVEARPEEIRQHLEEAAGISRYKERRRETERRIEHTRENLERLADLREEVGNHLGRLKRQARAAERYRKLKQQKRELESRLLAIRWREQVRVAEQGKSGLGVQETALQEQLAAQRAAESRMEELHQQQAEASEGFNAVQGELYSVASDIARLEQDMAHSLELQHRQQEEHQEVSAAVGELEQHMALDRAQAEHLKTGLAESEPALKQAEQAVSEAEQALADIEQAVQGWQEEFEGHHRSSSEQSRKTDGLRARVEVLDQRMKSAGERIQALEEESGSGQDQASADEIASLEEKVKRATGLEHQKRDELEKLKSRLDQARAELRELRDAEYELQNQLNATGGRLEALQGIQQLAGESEKGQTWLAEQGLAEAPQLAAQIETQKGWETAVETVLGAWLRSLLVGDAEQAARQLGSLEEAEIGILRDQRGDVRPRSGTLAEKVKAPDAVLAMLNHVRVVEDLESALPFLDVAGAEESAITREGEWIGPGWVRVSRAAGGESGILAREREIRALASKQKQLAEQLGATQAGADDLAEGIQTMEDALEAGQAELNDTHRLRSELESQLSGLKARLGDLQQREARNAQETQRLQAQQQADSREIKSLRGELESCVEAMAKQDARREELEAQRQPLMEQRNAARKAALAAREQRHELALKTESRRASLESLQQSLTRMDQQLDLLQQRHQALGDALAKASDPKQAFAGEMDGLLHRRVEVEERLAAARAKLQALEEDYRQQDSERQEAVGKTEEIRATLERARLQQQEVELTARDLQKRVEELGQDVTTLAEDLPEAADAGEWKEDIERLAERIARLEPVNLAAIQEYEEELKRKEYMDAQNEDLTRALETLESAIARIDRKTRTRFKDTFEQVNKGVQELFPRLFGGGHAYLELTGDDLLTTGVSIMARPPGKRVSSIHLLSGGEKALTAVAFVFAIFQLNPAPFCLLDEVDAPLDDANIGRFSALVREMSETVQFIVVTHNKITMEMVHQLSGVTMREPGVSRLVQVDIEEAARLASS
jgi:chromosome segregation protein